MRSKSGFTMIETLVVMAIIAILVAILVPVIFAARNRGKISACQSNLYQYGRADEMEGDGRQDVSHCPYPQGDDNGAYIDVTGNYRPNDPNYAPDGGTVKVFCVEHLARGTSTPFEVPLRGKFAVLKFAGGVGIIDARGVTRWQKQGKNWVEIAETGDIPQYPQIWHFAREDFPP
jgi:prepilin-type N-terminal cleavage/methylation domain-containing protein